LSENLSKIGEAMYGNQQGAANGQPSDEAEAPNGEEKATPGEKVEEGQVVE
jgi:hypothetical protein